MSPSFTLADSSSSGVIFNCIFPKRGLNIEEMGRSAARELLDEKGGSEIMDMVV